MAFRTVAATALALALAAGPARAQDDRLEGFNRSMFAFNAAVVVHVIEPSAAFLEAWVPASLQRAAANIYENVTEPEFIVTNLLSGNHEHAWISTKRFLINSTLGVGGLFEVAAEFGLERHEVEFTEAMCRAGMPPTPYIVLPLVGPATVANAASVTGFFAVEWYLLSMISTVLATADLVVDLSASAASLRYVDQVPGLAQQDPYTVQRDEFLSYMRQHCGEAATAVH